jgi:hypothetical protein
VRCLHFFHATANQNTYSAIKKATQKGFRDADPFNNKLTDGDVDESDEKTALGPREEQKACRMQFWVTRGRTSALCINVALLFPSCGDIHIEVGQTMKLVAIEAA